MILTRRRFLCAAASLLAAPAIVRAASIMPVRALAPAFEMQEVKLSYGITQTVVASETREASLRLLWGQIYAAEDARRANFFTQYQPELPG